MLGFLQEGASGRKLRLFASACCRAVWDQLTTTDQAAIVAAEQYAEGCASWTALRDALAEVYQVSREDGGLLAAPQQLIIWALAPSPFDAALWTARRAGCTDVLARSWMARLLRDIFFNPFQPLVLDPAWLQWNQGAVRHLAQAIYDGRRFQDMPALGDALEKAGCREADILDHCRAADEHTRGCWVLDHLLGKG
jgi:hypothetical protein